MAGRPIENAMVKLLTDGGPDLEEKVFTYFVEGHGSIAKLAKHFEVNLRSLYRWLKADPDRWQRWQEAKELRAEVLAEGTLDISEDSPTLETMEGLRRAELKVKVRQWLAACNAPTVYGKNQKVTVNHEHLHLVALKEINAADTKRRLESQAVKQTELEYIVGQPELEGDDTLGPADESDEVDIFG